LESKSQTGYKKRIGELLIDAGIIRAEELPVGLKQANERSLRLGEVLVMLRYLSAEDLEAVLQAQTRMTDGSISERQAVEGLKIASSHRIPFDKALEKVEKEPQERRPDLVAQLKNLQEQLVQTERVRGANSRDSGNIILAMGETYRQLGASEEMESHYRKAWQILERSCGPRNIKLAPCLSKLADLYFSQNRLADAEALYWRVLDITQEAWGNEHLDVAKCKQSLGRLLETQSRFKEAEQFYLSSLRIIENLAGEDHADFTDALRNLASFWAKQGKRPERHRLGDLLVEAGLLKPEQLQQALQQVSQSGRPLGQALVRLNYLTEDDLRPALQAQLLIGDGVLPLPIAVRALRLARQKRTFQEALEELGWEPDRFTTHELRTLIAAAEELMSAEVALGPEHAGVAILSMKLADIYTAQRKFNEADPLYQRAIEILEKSFGPKDPEVATGLYKLALLNINMGKLMDADRALWRAVEIRQHVHGATHAEMADCLEALAQVQQKQSNYEQAEKFYQSSASIRETTAGKTHPKTLSTLQNLAEVYSLQSKLEDAETVFLRLLRARENECGPMHTDLVPLLEKLGSLYLTSKEYSKAETQFELALDILDKDADAAGKAGREAHARLVDKYSGLLEKTDRKDAAKKMRARIHPGTKRSP
jgi:tetratricopeptide (TPR) repeat protein